MVLRDKKLLIFDLDGTLIDSAPDLALSINYMLDSLDRPPFKASIIDGWVGNGAQALVKRALSGSQIVDETIADDLFLKAIAIFLDYYEKNCCVATQCYKNVSDTLKILQEQDYTLSIVTNKPFKFVAPILKQLEIFDYFSFYIGGDSLDQKKPAPEPLLHVCNKLNFSPSNTVMIGDSKNDILAAHAASIESIAVSYGYNYGEDIASFNPNVTIDNFADILKVIE